MSRSADITFDGFDFEVVDGPVTSQLGGGPMARVHILSSEIEAQVLMGVLVEEGIEAVVQTYRELAFDGLFIPQRGWGCIITREDDAEKARLLIDATLATVGQGGDPEPEPTAGS